MRQIMDMAFKDLRLILRDKMGLFFIFCFPLGMGLFFGLMFGGSSSDTASLELAIVDHDQSEMSGKLIAALQKTGSVVFTRLDADDQALEKVRKGQLAGLLIIPAGYGETAGVFWPQGDDAKPLQIATDPSRSAEAAMLEGLIMQASGELIQARFTQADAMQDMRKKLDTQIRELAAAGEGPIAGLEAFSKGMDEFTRWIGEREAAGEESAAPGGFNFVQIEKIDVTRELSAQQKELAGLRSPWDISFPSAIMWGVLGTVASFAISLVKERTGGTLVRLQVAPITRSQLLGGKAMACFLTVLAVNAVLILVGYGLGMRPQSFGLLFMAVLSLAVCFVGIMMVMSVIGKTEEAVGGAGWGINLIMAMFGGGMVPLAFMPSFMKTVSNFSPVKWGVLSLEGAIWRGFTFSEMLRPCGILVGVGVAAFLVGSLILQRRQAHS